MSGVTDKKERLQKIMAATGKYSRREAEELVGDGAVTINGKVANLGDKAIPGKDHIKVNGKLLKTNDEIIVVAYFKPREVLTTNDKDPKGEHRGSVMGSFATKIKANLKPIGQLDFDTEGLLLLTNNGDLIHRLTRSKTEVPRIYSVKIDGHLEDKKVRRLLGGIDIEGKRVRAAEVERIRQNEGKEWLKVTVTDARNRIIRKLFENVGHPVDKVQRIGFANVSISGINRGEFRFLDSKEIEELRKIAGLV